MSAFTIRQERAADVSAVFALNQIAFGGTAEPRLVDDLRQEGFAEISLVAEGSLPENVDQQQSSEHLSHESTQKAGAAQQQQQRIIGHIMLSPLEGPLRALSLAPLAVHPHRQRRGVGTALVREALKIAEADAWQAVFVLGNPAYYSRFGFSVELARPFTCPYSGDHFMAIALGDTRLNAYAGKLVYPPPFQKLG